jgi:hypothetical protein
MKGIFFTTNSKSLIEEPRSKGGAINTNRHWITHFALSMVKPEN